MAKASISCGSSFRSFSPAGLPDDPLTSVAAWMNKTEAAENVVQSKTVSSVYPQSSVSIPVKTVARRAMLRPSEGLETLSETYGVHRSRCAS